MATESDLRGLLRDPDPEGGGAIDLDAVLSRARRRRRPRVIAASAAGALAVAGVLTPVVVLSLPSQQGVLMVAEDSSAGGEAAPEADNGYLVGAPFAWNLNSCASPIAETPVAESGLVLDVAPLTASAGSASIPVTVTLRNDGDVRSVGITSPQPDLTFSREGTVLWHTNGARDSNALEVDLDPGESMTYQASFEPVVCGPEDEAEGFRRDLPPAGPGGYEIGAAIDFYPDGGTAGPELVSGPAAPVELR